MFSIIGADGKEYGPVAPAKIQEWIAGGRANLQTRARRYGDTEWRTLGDYPEFVSAAVPPAAAPVTPVAATPGADIPAAAPLAAPLATPMPAPATNPVDAKTYAAELIARSSPLDVFGCIGQAFEFWKANLLPLVGVTTLVLIIVMVLGMIPFVGAIANLVLTGVFYGGLYYYYLGKMRGEHRELGDAFAGFSRHTGSLVLGNVLIVLISAVVALVLFAPWIVVVVLVGNGTLPKPVIAVGIGGMVLSAIPLIYLSVAWAMTLPLIIDQGLSPWTAMEVSRRVINKQWFRVFGAVFLGGLIAALGVLGLIIGVFFTIPIAAATMLYVYEHLFRPPPRQV